MLYYNALVDSDNPLGYAAGRDCVLEDNGRGTGATDLLALLYASCAGRPTVSWQS